MELLKITVLFSALVWHANHLTPGEDGLVRTEGRSMATKGQNPFLRRIATVKPSVKAFPARMQNQDQLKELSKMLDHRNLNIFLHIVEFDHDEPFRSRVVIASIAYFAIEAYTVLFGHGPGNDKRQVLVGAEKLFQFFC